MSSEDNTSKKDIWSATTYGQKVAPFVAKLTTRIVEWLDPQPEGDFMSKSAHESC